MKGNTKFSNNGVKNGNVKTSSKTKSMTAVDLRGLFINQLKDIYWTEKALIKTSSKMANKATSKELRDAIQDHLAETEGHVTRLEKVFSTLAVKPEAVKSEAMSGLIKEAEQMVDETEKGPVRDAAIIFAIQKIEHYEIATYGTLCAFAKVLDETKVLSFLEDTISEEKAGDERLTDIAETIVNIDALQEHA